MKGNFTSLNNLLQFVGKSMFVMLFCACFTSNASAQTSAASDLGDLSAVNWKATADLNLSIAVEQAKANLALSAPSMQLDEKALYLSYTRMLNYIQTNLQAGKTADEAIALSYEQVLSEAPKDADLTYLPDGLLATFVPSLVETFTVSPKPGN